CISLRIFLLTYRGLGQCILFLAFYYLYCPTKWFQKHGNSFLITKIIRRERHNMRIFFGILVGLIGGFVLGIALASFIGVFGIILFNEPMGIKYLSYFTAI